MTIINQNGDNSQATGGSNSPINNRVKISITTKQKAGWFFTGLFFPIVVGIIVEIITNGFICGVFEISGR